MASADVTCSPSGYEFEADATQHKATLTRQGGWVRNTGSVDAEISPDDAAISTTAPSGAGVIRLGVGKSCQLPPECQSFTFKAASSTFLQYSGYPLVS